MTKKQLAKYMKLDFGYCTKMEDIDPGTALEYVYKELDPDYDWESWVENGFPEIDNYVYTYFDNLVLYGALVRKFGNDIPKDVVDEAYLDDDYNWDFTRLADLYREVYVNIGEDDDVKEDYDSLDSDQKDFIEDTLRKIAKRYGMTWEEFCDLDFFEVVEDNRPDMRNIPFGRLIMKVVKAEKADEGITIKKALDYIGR